MAGRGHNAGMKLPTILLTGFDAFGGETLNPSWLVAQALHGKRLAGWRVAAHCLPCVFGQSLHSLDGALARVQPRLVLLLGQAGGRSDLSLERVAINIDDARIPDNQGQQPIDDAVVPGAPAAYFSSLPIKAMVAALQNVGLPASVSQTAGTFVCNHVFFGLMHTLQRRPGVRGGFMHLPLLPVQAAGRPGQPSMQLATMVDGVRLALQTAVQAGADVRLTGGTEA
jgi:pyroglutamyl-peptidase